MSDPISPARQVAATLGVLLLGVAIWWLVEWRSQPPAPPPRSIDPYVAIPR